MRIARYLTMTPGVAFTTAQAFNSLGRDSAQRERRSRRTSPRPGTPPRTVERSFAAASTSYLDVDAAAIANFTVGDRGLPYLPLGRAEPDLHAVSAPTAVGSPAGPSVCPAVAIGFDANGQPCAQKLKVPRTWEYTLGAEREIIQGDRAGRRRGLPEVHQSVRDHRDQPGVEPVRERRSRQAAPSAMVAAEIVQDIETPEGARRSYLGNTVSVHKREGKVQGQRRIHVELSSRATSSTGMGNSLR